MISMRKRAAFGAGLAIVLGVVGVSGVDSARSATSAASAGGRTIRLFEHDTQQGKVDVGPKGDSPGDQFIWSGDLFDHKGGKKLGRTGGTCDTTGTAPHGDSLCTASFMLPGGQILTQGLSDTVALFSGETVRWAAIIGGTGIYRDAHGYSTVAVPTDVPNQTDAIFVLYLS
jgi:hypothetical protein